MVNPCAASGFLSRVMVCAVRPDFVWRLRSDVRAATELLQWWCAHKMGRREKGFRFSDPVHVVVWCSQIKHGLVTGLKCCSCLCKGTSQAPIWFATACLWFATCGLHLVASPSCVWGLFVLQICLSML